MSNEKQWENEQILPLDRDDQFAMKNSRGLVNVGPFSGCSGKELWQILILATHNC